ncbi:MAG: ABC transporter permease [Spirochaetales bacterium]|nr:ABC transporter permease [Spirochaetales bacterium]MCF7937292.1 ABC transporter permease [Spirochaetales bacterium]
MVARIGHWVNGKIRDSVYAAGYFYETIKALLLFFRRRQVGYKVLTMQMLFTGVEALGVISLLSLSLGAVIIIEGLILLPQFGQGDLIYTILITIITRELGPILTAFIIIARSGTAISTEIGNMVVSHEIEAYVSFGINPISYLVVPRFLGVTFSMVLLNLYFNIFGLIGSYLLGTLMQPIGFSEYLNGLLSVLTTADIISSLGKSAVFGMIISLVSTYYGFKVERATTEVPQKAIKAVGHSIVLCILANVVLTLFYYL